MERSRWTPSALAATQALHKGLLLKVTFKIAPRPPAIPPAVGSAAQLEMVHGLLGTVVPTPATLASNREGGAVLPRIFPWSLACDSSCFVLLGECVQVFPLPPQGS